MIVVYIFKIVPREACFFLFLPTMSHMFDMWRSWFFEKISTKKLATQYNPIEKRFNRNWFSFSTENHCSKANRLPDKLVSLLPFWFRSIMKFANFIFPLKRFSKTYSPVFLYNFIQRPRLWAFGGLRERSLSPCDKVNAGAKPAKCTSASHCP